MATVEELHATSKIVEVDVTKLRVDSSYQRDVSEKLVDEIANDWDAVAAELLTVADRGNRNGGPVEGGLFIVNGQHRAKAAQKIGMVGGVWARVIDLGKEEDPAMIEARFRLRTNKRIGDRPLERFKAQLRAGDEESIAIVKIVTSYGSEINLIPSDTGINCISTIETMYRNDNGATLSRTLKVVNDSYGHVGGKNAGADILKAVFWFIEKHSDESDRDRLIDKLKKIGRAAIEQRGRGHQLAQGGPLWVNHYRAIVELYNEQLRDKNRLQWKLRGKSVLARGNFATT